MEGRKRTRKDSADSSKSNTDQRPTKRIDFASGDGLQHGESSTAQQDTHEDTQLLDVDDQRSERFINAIGKYNTDFSMLNMQIPLDANMHDIYNIRYSIAQRKGNAQGHAKDKYIKKVCSDAERFLDQTFNTAGYSRIIRDERRSTGKIG